MRTTTGIKCANCHDYHPTVADVRNCCLGITPASSQADDDAMEQHYQQQAEAAAEERYERWLEDGGEHSERISWENQLDAALHEDDGDAWMLTGSTEPEVTTTEPPATQKQMDYLRSLWRERGESPATNLSKNEASAEIQRLLGLPKVPTTSAAPALADVPAGRYALRDGDGSVRFYIVDKPLEGRWAGRTFVSRQASDDKYPVRNPTERANILEAIEHTGVKESMLLYGKEIGSCGHCGRTLTNDESRAAGIGPICRGKMGW